MNSAVNTNMQMHFLTDTNKDISSIAIPDIKSTKLLKISKPVNHNLRISFAADNNIELQTFLILTKLQMS